MRCLRYRSFRTCCCSRILVPCCLFCYALLLPRVACSLRYSFLPLLLFAFVPFHVVAFNAALGCAAHDCCVVVTRFARLPLFAVFTVRCCCATLIALHAFDLVAFAVARFVKLCLTSVPRSNAAAALPLDAMLPFAFTFALGLLHLLVTVPCLRVYAFFALLRSLCRAVRLLRCLFVRSLTAFPLFALLPLPRRDFFVSLLRVTLDYAIPVGLLVTLRCVCCAAVRPRLFAPCCRAFVCFV